MDETKPLIIFGCHVYASLVYEYFTHDSSYEVVAFSVHQDYIKQDTFCGLPIVPFETIEQTYSPQDYVMHVASVYGRLNRDRQMLCEQAKQKGYRLANYISSNAFIWPNVKLGDNVFIFEDNTVQPFVEIGSHVVIWSGNHIGHHTTIDDNCFISSHVAISGFCHIKPNTFIGVNTAIADQVTVGESCWLGHGSVISHDIPDKHLVKAAASPMEPIDEERFFKHLEKLSRVT